MADQTERRRKVLLVGWDAADWKNIRPLLDAGGMPGLRSLIARGCTAPIATLQPSLSPMLWTTIATGKRPFSHGIHGFTEPRSDGRGVHRITNLSRKCKALWNILGQNGLRSIVVGWWPSYPAEPISGAMVSDQFHRIVPDFKLVPGMVHPAHSGESLASLRLNPEDLPAGILENFVPRAREIDQSRDQRLLMAARIIAECANIHNAATWLMDREPWDLCAVYFDAIDHFGHGFMRYHPPRRADVSEEDFAQYRNVLAAGYRLHDSMLETLLQKAGDDATVILLSDHGFHPDHLRAASIPQTHAGPACEHRNNGVFVIAGPGIRRGENLPGVNLFDITPTVLTLFGLPAGADMDGKVLAAAFETPPETARIPSWEKVDGEDGRHPPHMQIDLLAATESMEQLVALGYVEQPDADHEIAARHTLTELRTNLAESYQDAGRHGEALAILKDLRESSEGRDDQRVALRLFISAEALRRTSEMQAISDDWAGRRREVRDRALGRIADLRALAREGTDLNEQQRAELRQLRRACRYDASLAVYFQSRIFRAKRRWNEALACLDRIPASDLIRPAFHTDRAELLGRLERWQEASEIVQNAIESDPEDARAHFCRSRIRLHLGDFTAAAHSALDGIALMDREPMGHYLLGIALFRLQIFERAMRAFGRALALNPNFPEAHLWLARIHRHSGFPDDSAAFHSHAFLDLQNERRKNSLGAGGSHARRQPSPGPKPVAFAASAASLPPLTDEVVIVTGLPRSGTSMIMQMLVAGGIVPLTDGLRQADDDNPRGYFEYEPVRQMAQGAPWIEDARGKAVKIVAPMIPHLPAGVRCRVILIERDLNDILASQRQMIARRGRNVEETPERLTRLRQEYLRLIVWTKGFLAGRTGTSLLCVNRNAVLSDPRSAAEAMNRFLGSNLSVERMTAEVKPALDRHKSVIGVT